MNKIAIDITRAITPPSLFGIDRRIAYADRKKTAFEQDQDGPAQKLSSNLYDMYQCRVYSE